ncbi:hypothetical protein L1987_46983 [Smallanthus sonchifolius]|uniref:Uncharacterized protein n=1 Tax=Smallanthus sonchifolius TaxID=185202 RepID=A0ACB9G1B4_9ASTR|nr:hypothetical protein L1987_46983 [Smallanthus sonchifolius]
MASQLARLTVTSCFTLSTTPLLSTFDTQLRNWGNFNGDFCSLVSSPQVRIKCEDNSISVLKIMRDKLSKAEQEFTKLKKLVQPLERQHVISSNQADSVNEVF